MTLRRPLEVSTSDAPSPVDFRTLLLGAWPDGQEEDDAAALPADVVDAADDPQWIVWTDAGEESAWAAGEVPLTLGAGRPRRVHTR